MTTRQDTTTILRRSLLLMLSMGIGFALLEVGFRWFRWRQLGQIDAPGYAYHFMQPDPVYHHRYAASTTVRDRRVDYDVTYTLNALGLRGSRDAGPKPAGVARLLMLGDSFPFGIGVNDDEPFPVLVQQALDAREAGIEVINAGVGSYSPILHYLTLRDRYLAWDPDAVILWLDFCDIQDDDLYARHLLYDDEGRVAACNSDYVNGRIDWGGRLLLRSAFLKYLHEKFVRSARKMQMLGVREYLWAKLRGEDTKLNAVHMEGKRRARVALVRYDRFLMIRGAATPAELERYWQLTGSYLLKIKALLDERGIPFVLGMYPYGVQVGPAHWHDGRVYHMFEQGRTYDDPLPFEFVEAFGARHGIPVINSYPSFVAARDEQLFLPMDGHFTPAGHRVLASHLLRDPIFLNLMDGLRGEADLWSPPGKPGAPLRRPSTRPAARDSLRTTPRRVTGDIPSEGPPAKAGARVEGSGEAMRRGLVKSR